MVSKKRFDPNQQKNLHECAEHSDDESDDENDDMDIIQKILKYLWSSR